MNGDCCRTGGFHGESDITILTPYVGQLLRLRTELAKSTMVFVNERDTEAMATAGLEARS
jgi:hypothetical protein